ncbi:MAG: 3-oxoacyl-ACP reductase FabG [Ktedonobacteraceae bacterium]|nr:3-oxoacyl-ACP reductase FabG [Ktedonobacteraceae bacterium]
MMDIHLQGKIALVTGAGAGIGRAVAVELARCGATVIVNYRQNEAGARETLALVEQVGSPGLLFQADVARTAETQGLMNEIADRWGRLDILINNAGGLIQRAKICEMSEELWDEVIAINLKSAFLCCRAAIPLMSGHGWGRIINLSSLAAHDGGGPGAVPYATTKGAILTFTRGLAKELASQGITVNCVAPGLINTAFHDTFSTPQSRRAMVNNTPLAREGQPVDVAASILFLVSELASFITGEVININGGMRMC